MIPTDLRQAADMAVVLPGTGSDEVFVRRVFAGPLNATGLRLYAPFARPGAGLAEEQLAALDAAAAAHGPIVAGGISLGAHLATEWALANPGRCAGLLLAMPGWTGQPGEAPGAVAARVSAAAIDAHGLDTALADAIAGVPEWLAVELARAWHRGAAGLAEALRIAASRPAPTPAALASLDIPAGVAGCSDDQVHPLAVAESWATALPNATLRTITFADLGANPAALGQAAITALTQAAKVPPAPAPAPDATPPPAAPPSTERAVHPEPRRARP